MEAKEFGNITKSIIMCGFIGLGKEVEVYSLCRHQRILRSYSILFKDTMEFYVDIW